MTGEGVVMAIDVGDHLPENFDELDALAASIYKQGVEAGKTALRADIKSLLNKEVLAAKGKERRPNPDDPKVQAIRSITEKLYAAFEDGTL
jgi:hypothetical protein